MNVLHNTSQDIDIDHLKQLIVLFYTQSKICYSRNTFVLNIYTFFVYFSNLK